MHRRARRRCVAASVALLITSFGAPALADAPSNTTSYRDDRNGFSLLLPSAWQRSAPRVLLYPLGLLAVVDAEQPVPGSDGCSSVEGISDPPGTGVRVELREYDRAYRSQPPRTTFGPFSGATATAGPAVPGCPGESTEQTIVFRDKGRSFVASIIFGAHAPAERRAEAYEILNSLQFARASELDRPPIRGPVSVPTYPNVRSPHPVQEINVLVLNGVGLDAAAAAMANQLRGVFGYGIAGTGNAPRQEATTVACRARYRKDAKILGQSVGPGTKVVPFPSSPPSPDTRSATCIVTLGG